MRISDANSPKNILRYFKENIKYGWFDSYGNKHTQNMENFREFYVTSSLENTASSGFGTCIEQAALMKSLFDKIGITCKLFCCRLYESIDFKDTDNDVYMHCFLLFYDKEKVIHLDASNEYKKVFYEYDSEEKAIKTIMNYYEIIDAVKHMTNNKETPTNGFHRLVSEFFDVPVGLSFGEFNDYINIVNHKQKNR